MLVLVEFIEDCPMAIRQRRVDPDQIQLVALTPEAADCLDAQGQPYLLPYHPEDIPHLRAWTTDNLRRTEQLSKWLAQRLADRVPQMSRTSFNPLRCHFLEAFTLLNAYTICTYALRHLCRRTQATRILFFRPHEPAASPLVFQPGESVWGEVAHALQHRTCRPAWAEGISWSAFASRATRASVQRRVRANFPWERRLRNWACRQKRRVRAWSQPWRGSLPLRTEPNAPRSLVLAVGSGPDLTWIFEEISRRPTCQLLHWAMPDEEPKPAPIFVPPELWTLMTEFFSDEAVGVACTWEGADWRPAMRVKWEGFFRVVIPSAWAHFLSVRNVLAARRPAVVLHGELGHGSWERTCLEAARSFDVPTAFHQWGGGYGYYQQAYLQANELQSDVALVYTPTIAEVFDRQVADSRFGARARSLAVGSCAFVDFHERVSAAGVRRGSSRYVVYLPTCLKGAYWYGQNGDLEDTLAFALQKAILNALVAWGRLPVVLKLHPNPAHAPEPTRAWLRRQRLPITVNRRPLAELLHAEYLWVVDAPSTVFQEILVAGGQAIVVNSGSLEFHPGAEAAMREGARVVDGWSADFDRHLRDALEALFDGWRPNPEPFLSRYVGSTTSLTAQATASRALERLLNALQSAPIPSTKPVGVAAMDAAYEVAG
jgi:hypothetical protein